MDNDFLANLDAHISNVGRDEYWKKEIGDHTIWLSPISYVAQTKVTETLANSDLGSNVIAETKRVTMANSIVGIDDIDLRPYRNQGEVFPIPDPRQPGNIIKVDLPKYLYHRMESWGNDWMDVAFDVFVDLMQTFEKHNKSKIKFENVKDPYDELTELEMRVGELREKLKLPPLIEKKENTAPETPEKPTEEPKAGDIAFDPFKRLPDQTEGQENIPQKPPETKIDSQPQQPPPVPEVIPPVTTVPVPDLEKMTPIELALVQRAQNKGTGTTILSTASPISSRQNPLPALPSVKPEVVERRSEPIAPLSVNKINPVNQSKNPRFSKPNR